MSDTREVRRELPVKWNAAEQVWEIRDLTIALPYGVMANACSSAKRTFEQRLLSMPPGSNKDALRRALKKLTPELTRQVFRPGPGDRVLYEASLPDHAKKPFSDLGKESSS